MVSTLYLECGPESACFPNFAYKFNVLWVNVLCRYVEEAESHAGRVKKATALAAVEDVQRWRLIQQRRDASSENSAMLDHEKTYEDAELRKEGGLVAGARDTGLKENVSTFANKVGTMEEVGSATTFHSRYFAVGNAVVHVTILTPGSDNPSMTYDKNTTNRVTPGSACNPTCRCCTGTCASRGCTKPRGAPARRWGCLYTLNECSDPVELESCAWFQPCAP
jgi:hypothetical protein